jgi:hypothetical protein
MYSWYAIVCGGYRTSNTVDYQAMFGGGWIWHVVPQQQKTNSGEFNTIQGLSIGIYNTPL